MKPRCWDCGCPDLIIAEDEYKCTNCEVEGSKETLYYFDMEFVECKLIDEHGDMVHNGSFNSCLQKKAEYEYSTIEPYPPEEQATDKIANLTHASLTDKYWRDGNH